jgi:hypothetical protein
VTHADIALIVIAAVALTLAAALVAFHLYLRSYRRTLAHVREQRNRWWREARRLRADRPAVHRTLAAHARQAIALTEPIPYRLADRTEYLPVWTSDGPAMQEYVQLRDASRQARQVTSW